MNILIKTSLGYDGIATITMNYCCALSNYCNYTFFVIGSPESVRNEYLEIVHKNGWKIVYAPDSFKHFFKYKKVLKETLKKEAFDVFHINGNSSLMMIDYLICKKVSKSTKVIAHSHNSNCSHRLIHFLIKPFFSFTNPTRIACSTCAGVWAFGKKKKFIVLPNAIDYSLFYYNENFRDELKKKYGLQDKKVILHIGAFVSAKNHFFITNVLKSLISKEKSFVAVFVGDGELKQSIEDRCSSLGISDKTLFVGSQKNANKFYSMADVFVLPSFYEGLPVVLLEAQVSGLPCVVSNNVSKEAKITDNIVYLGIKDCDIESWVQAIYSGFTPKKRTFGGDITFSVDDKAKHLLDCYSR